MRMSVRLRRTATLSATTTPLLTLLLEQEILPNVLHAFQNPYSTRDLVWMNHLNRYPQSIPASKSAVTPTHFYRFQVHASVTRTIISIWRTWNTNMSPVSTKVSLSICRHCIPHDSDACGIICIVNMFIGVCTWTGAWRVHIVSILLRESKGAY